MSENSKNKIKAWLDGETSAEATREIERLIASDSEAARMAADLRKLSQALQNAEDVVPPMMPVANLWSRARAARSDVDKVIRMLQRTAAAAAAVLLLATGFSLAVSPPTVVSESVAGPARNLSAPRQESIADFLSDQEMVAALSFGEEY